MIFKKKTLQKLCKNWHPEVKLSSFFSCCFFSCFCRVLELETAKEKLVKFAGDGKTEEISIEDALKDKKARFWESHQVGDYIPSVGRLYPCYCHLTAAPNLPEELVISDG